MNKQEQTAVTGEGNAPRVKTYKVKAIRLPHFGVSRHGISSTKGGEIAGIETFDYLFTPFYMADEIMHERFPDCEIIIETPKWWLERGTK